MLRCGEVWASACMWLYLFASVAGVLRVGGCVSARGWADLGDLGSSALCWHVLAGHLHKLLSGHVPPVPLWGLSEG
jgi:hypothetical protein